MEIYETTFSSKLCARDDCANFYLCRVIGDQLVVEGINIEQNDCPLWLCYQEHSCRYALNENIESLAKVMLLAVVLRRSHCVERGPVNRGGNDGPDMPF